LSDEYKSSAINHIHESLYGLSEVIAEQENILLREALFIVTMTAIRATAFVAGEQATLFIFEKALAAGLKDREGEAT